MLANGHDEDAARHFDGLPQLKDVIVENDVDRVLLAFEEPDSGDFFGALRSCQQRGVVAGVERSHENPVLTDHPNKPVGTTAASERFVETSLESWNPQDQLPERAFGIPFAMTALLLTLPVMIVIAVAILFDSDDLVFFVQDRTFRLRGTFQF